MEEKQVVKLSPSRKAKSVQRQALHALLASDEEYASLEDHVDMDKTVGERIRQQLLEDFDGKPTASAANVMKILQYDMQGYSIALIAKSVGLDASQVSYIKSTDLYKDAKDEILKAVIESSRKYMEVATIKAVKTLVQCMDSISDKVRLAASQDVLNRAGLAAPQQIEITSNVNNFEGFTDDQLLEIMRKEDVVSSRAEVISIGPPDIIEQG